MIISEDLLLAYGAEYETYRLSQIIFQEAAMPRFYFQIVSGIVELNNYHEDGKEFIQNILSQGRSFGESFLFNDRAYPVNAIAKTDCKILKLSKPDFHNLLQHHPDVLSRLLKCMSDTLYNKYIMLYNISSTDPTFKIETLINCLKDNDESEKFSFQVPFTRKQLAQLTGLRVETVVRTVKKMETNHLLEIKNGKIFY